VIPKHFKNQKNLKIIDKGDILEVFDTKTRYIIQYSKEKLEICFVDEKQIEESMLKRPGFEYLQLQNRNQELLVFCNDQVSVRQTQENYLQKGIWMHYADEDDQIWEKEMNERFEELKISFGFEHQYRTFTQDEFPVPSYEYSPLWDSFSPIYAQSLVDDVSEFLDSKFDLCGSHQVLDIIISFVTTIKNKPGYYYVIPKSCENPKDLKIIDKGDIFEVFDNKTGKNIQYSKEDLQICVVSEKQIEESMLKRPGFEYLQLQNRNQELLVFCDDQVSAYKDWEWWGGTNPNGSLETCLNERLMTQENHNTDGTSPTCFWLNWERASLKNYKYGLERITEEYVQYIQEREETPRSSGRLFFHVPEERNRQKKKLHRNGQTVIDELGSISEFHHRKAVKTNTWHIRKKKYRKNRRRHKDRKNDLRGKNAWKRKKDRRTYSDWERTALYEDKAGKNAHL